MNDSRNEIDLSIIVTAHNEGLIAHKTLLSIFEAVKPLSAKGISYEIIASVDKGDQDTLSYFRERDSKDSFKLLDVSFGDLSTSRNNAVKQSSGKYITFIDADDLMSSNWLDAGYSIALSHPNSVVHPEFSITFGDDNLIWQKRNSRDIGLDTLILVDNNLWDSPCLASRDTFTNNPYHPNGNGYGYEDKKFNSDTLARGISHIVASQTLLFVRRKNTGSMLRGAIADRVTVARNELLSYQNLLSVDLSKYNQLLTTQTPQKGSSLVHAKHAGKVVLKKLHQQAKKHDSYLKLVQPLREKRQEKIIASLRDRYPEWMLKLWREIHKIDNSTFPSKELLKSLPWYNAENAVPGLKYAQLIQSFSTQPDTLFFVPHIIKGGADMLFINYSTELKKLHPEWNIAMLQTEAKESVWRDKLSPENDFVDLFKLFQGLDNDTQYRLLATLVTQNDIKRIIIGNSQLAYDFASKYQTLLKTLDVAVYCFAFGEEFDDEGRLWGHIHTGIPRIYPVIHRVITDNENTVNKLAKEYAFERTRFAVHYQPTAAAVLDHPHTDHNPPLRILWASRVCKQKRPDILKAVSNQLDPKMYQVDAYGQLEEGLTEDYFKDSNVNYRGPFNGSSALPTDKYDVFLYTSEGDGVPNILQEITAAGLPIVASNVGGIREFIITNQTGTLIEDHENIDNYALAIHELGDPDLRQKLNNGARALLENQFSKDSWIASIKRDFDR